MGRRKGEGQYWNKGKKGLLWDYIKLCIWNFNIAKHYRIKRIFHLIKKIKQYSRAMASSNFCLISGLQMTHSCCKAQRSRVEGSLQHTWLPDLPHSILMSTDWAICYNHWVAPSNLITTNPMQAALLLWTSLDLFPWRGFSLRAFWTERSIFSGT